MDKQTKIVAAVFAVLVGYAIFDKVAYPVLDEWVLSIDAKIAEREEDRAALRVHEVAKNRAVSTYRKWIRRAGTYDARIVQEDIRGRITKLVAAENITEVHIGSPKIHTDSKTDVREFTFAITGEGTLESVVRFMKATAEFPQLVRLDKPQIRPVSGKRGTTTDRVSFSVKLEVRVPDRNKIVGVVPKDRMVLPTEDSKHIRYASADHSLIWKAKPFTEYKKPIKDVRNPPPKRTPQPPVETVVEKAPDPKPKAEPKPKKDLRWKNRKDVRIVIAFVRRDGTTPLDEIQLFDTKDRDNPYKYVAVGQDLDGGTLRMVHHTGAVVAREDGDFFYPIGQSLDNEVDLGEVTDLDDLYHKAGLLADASTGDRGGIEPASSAAKSGRKGSKGLKPLTSNGKTNSAARKTSRGTKKGALNARSRGRLGR